MQQQQDPLHAAAMRGASVFASLLGEREEQLDRLRTTVAALRWAAAENPVFDTPILLEVIGELVPAPANDEDAEQRCCQALIEALRHDRSVAVCEPMPVSVPSTMSIPMVLSLMYAMEESGGKEQRVATLHKLLVQIDAVADPLAEPLADLSAGEATGYRQVLAEYVDFLRKQGWEAQAERVGDGIRSWLVPVEPIRKARKTRETRERSLGARPVRRRKPAAGAN